MHSRKATGAYARNDSNGNAGDRPSRQERKIETFCSVSLLNCPTYRQDVTSLEQDPAVPELMCPEPTSGTLELCMVPAKGAAAALLSRTTAMKTKDVEDLQKGLRSETEQVRVQAVEINAPEGGEFHIALDGQVRREGRERERERDGNSPCCVRVWVDVCVWVGGCIA